MATPHQQSRPLTGPVIAAALGAGAAALAFITIGSYLDTPWRSLGTGEWRWSTAEHSLWEVPLLAAFVIVGLAVVFGVVVRTGLVQPAERVARRALVVALVGVASIVVFWTGLPVVLAVGAAVLALDARSRLGRLPASAGVALGLAALLVVGAGYLALAG